MFFGHIFVESNVYADYCTDSSMLNPRLCMRSWQPGRRWNMCGPWSNNIMGIMQKPALK